jgi:hypothetical protein
LELFWGKYGGDWEAAYQRLSLNLGIPDTDMNAWADSCPGQPGYDELGNYMTYNVAVCFAALGHFTAGQAQRAHYMTSELNPVLYTWGQYYAQNAAPPPPLASPPPESYPDVCKVGTWEGGCGKPGNSGERMQVMGSARGSPAWFRWLLASRGMQLRVECSNAVAAMFAAPAAL